MGDSVAPVISINDTKSDQTSKVTVEFQPVAPKTSQAISVTANSALSVALKSKLAKPSLPAPDVPTRDPSLSPTDYFFPLSMRNTAPFIQLVDNESISVKYEKVEGKVGNQSSNSVGSPAFWKQKQYKWVSDVDTSSGIPAPTSAATAFKPDDIDSKLFEKYFPSSIRNVAPFIEIRPPAGPWDTVSGYIRYGTEYVNFNPELSYGLTVGRSKDEGSIKACAAISKYFEGEFLNKAPVIEIKEGESVTIGWALTEPQES